MEAGSKQDGPVNRTKAMEALSPWLNHPRKTIIKVEGLVIAAAVLLLLQLILGSCRRRWHRSVFKYGLQVCNGIMFPLTVYTLGIMQSSPVKNSSYPVWAAFLIMASAGTTTFRQYDFYDSHYKKYIQIFVEYLRDSSYAAMFVILMDPIYNWQTALMNAGASLYFVVALVFVVLFTKGIESFFLVLVGYNGYLFRTRKLSLCPPDVEEGGNDRGCEFDSLNMKGCNYIVHYGPDRSITIEQIWRYCVINAGCGKALKDLCLSYALFGRLLQIRYFGDENRIAGPLADHDFVFKKMLPPQGDFKRAFKIIEEELGFCYDFFFTKYSYTFTRMFSTQPFCQSLFLLKIFLILVVGVFAIRKSLVLKTPDPIIEVHISNVDYIITLLVIIIALLVELVQAAFYLASNWAQVSLACTHVTKRWFEPNAYIFGKFLGYLRLVMISGKLRNKIDQHSIISPPKEQPDSVEVSDAVKTAIATSLRSTYANNLTTNEEASVRLRKQMLGKYSWALKDLSQLEVMLIWHIATEYCDAIADDPSDGNGGSTPTSNHRGVAFHLSRYCAYLIGSVPELLPYHQAYIREVTEKVTEERDELFGSYLQSESYYKMKNLQEVDEEDNPTTVFKKGVKLGKQLEKMADGNRWKVLEDFWADVIIQAAALHYTTKLHMQHLENGGEFLTHIWALLAHAGILDRDKHQQGQGVRIPEPHVQVTQEANLRSAPSQAETVIDVNDRRAFSGPL